MKKFVSVYNMLFTIRLPVTPTSFSKQVSHNTQPVLDIYWKTAINLVKLLEGEYKPDINISLATY